MIDLAVLNPEIEGLLREIAADPTSTLLRLPPSDLRRARRQGQLPDRAGTTGLNLAERELLRRWREEVAYLLLVACYLRQTSSQTQAHRLTAVDATQVPNLPGFWSRVRAAANFSAEVQQVDLEECTRLLTGFRRREISWQHSAMDLAIAAFRIVPSDMARCYAAVCLIVNDSPGAGLRMLVGAESRLPAVRRMVAVNTVYGHERSGSLCSALDATNGGDWPAGSETVRAVTGCVLSAQLGDETGVSRWITNLVQIGPKAETVHGIVRKARQRRIKGDWVPKAGAERRIRSAVMGCSWNIAQVANAFA